MLIGIISDSHENMDSIDKAVEIFNSRNVAAVLHAGDIISPITYSHFAKLKMPIYLVFGNNDGEKNFLTEKFSQIGTIKPAPYEFVLKEGENQLKFVLLHEPFNIDKLSESQKYNYIVYGHTHKQDLKTVGKTMIINPGESGGWLLGKKSVAILDTTLNKVEFIDL
ncbi:MAG: metallophosphoesterase [Endomicrobiia bacterium]